MRLSGKSLVLTPERKVVLERRGVEEPGPGQLLLRMLVSPVNPADLNVIEGTYPRCPELPGVIGNEGLGEIEGIGEGVEGFAVGDRVITLRRQGAWCEYRTVCAEDVVCVPAGVDPCQAAMMSVNPPTAYRMLHDFQPLESGDWVLQNASNSGVGRAVIQLCASLGLHTVNIVRQGSRVSELKDLGADEVFTEEQLSGRVLRERPELGPFKLALNAVGGRSAADLSKALARRGTMVTYGAMAREPVTVGNGQLIFKDLRLRGFFITGWYEQASRGEVERMFEQLWPLAERGGLHVPVEARYSLDQYAEALEHAGREGRTGKIVFSMEGA